MAKGIAHGGYLELGISLERYCELVERETPQSSKGCFVFSFTAITSGEQQFCCRLVFKYFQGPLGELPTGGQVVHFFT